MFYCGGWVDGWMGGWMDGWVDGWVGYDILPPSIFFVFKHDNKQPELIPNICLKVAYAFLIRSYEHFNFQNQEI